MTDYEKRSQRMIKRWLGESTVSESKTTQHKKNINCHKKSNVSTSYIQDEKIIEPLRSLPILKKCEVLVVGAGPAGIAAAISSARAGSETVIVDRYGAFGGVITHVGMETLGWYRYQGCVEANGIGIEMEKKAAMMGGTTKWPFNDSECLDAEYFKIVSDELITENNVTPILYCLAVDAIVQNNAIHGIIVESKSGRQAILAKRVIDCTGDADVAYHCGSSFRQADVNDMLGVSMIFSVCNVNTDKFLHYVQSNPRTYKDWHDDWSINTGGNEQQLQTPYLGKEFSNHKWQVKLPENVQIGGTWSSLSKYGEAKNLNLVYMKGLNGTCVMDLTKGTIEGRKQSLNAIDALRKNVPGFEDVVLRNFSATLGVRDTRKIIGKYNLTAQDVQGQARFDDSVGIFPEFIDGYNILTLPTTGRYFHVPFGCMVPPNVDNLLVAGRCVAGDELSHAAMRNMMACTVTGQAAGIAASVSVANNQSIHALSLKLVHNELNRQDVRYY